MGYLSKYMIATGGVALLALSVTANAIPIQASYTINAHNNDPGLKIQTADVASNPFNFSLSVGGSKTFGLFDIWTNESAINDDDGASKNISVDFTFSLPKNFNGSAGGSSQGTLAGFFDHIQYGQVNWNNPTDFYFGPNGDGHILLTLSDETFNRGDFWGTTPGRSHGATVNATFTLLADATAVPEPAQLGLLGFGLLLIGGLVRRRRQY